MKTKKMTEVINRISESMPTGNGESAEKVKGKKPPRKEEVRMLPLEVEVFEVKIRGIGPLVCHAFDAKNIKQIEDKQQGKAQGPRKSKDPDAERKACYYMMPGSPPPETKGAKYGIKACGFKKALVSACRYVDGISMALARGAFFVLDDGGGLVQLRNHSEPVHRTDTVRIGIPPRTTLDIRYRPDFTEWEATLKIQFDRSVISAEKIINLVARAGFHIGWGENRPEKSGDTWGRWEVVK